MDLYELRESASFMALSNSKKVQYFEIVAKKALPLWGYRDNTKTELLNYTENATFKIYPLNGRPFIMRIHRTLYTNEQTILTEMAWLHSLNQDGVKVPRPIKNLKGEYISIIEMPECHDFRYVDCEKFEIGVSPQNVSDPFMFEKLGELIARIHLNSESFIRPAFYQRIDWDMDKTIEKRNNFHFEWFRENTNFNKKNLLILSEAVNKVKYRIEMYGKSSQKYGLIHSDLRFSNVLVNNGEFIVLDFDDCGDGWYMYDLASVLGFNEFNNNSQELMHRVIKGYKRVRHISSQDEGMLPTFQLLRSIGLTCTGMFFQKYAVYGKGENVDDNNIYWKRYDEQVVKMALRYIT